MKGLFKKIDGKYIKITGIALGIVFLLLFIGTLVIYNKREELLHRSIEQVKDKAKNDYQIDLTVKEAYFSGIREVTLKEIKAIPQGKAGLLNLSYLDVSVKFWPLLTGKVKIADLHLNDATITFVKKDSISNYDFLFRKRHTKQIDSTSQGANLAVLANNLINSFLYKIPENMELRNLDILYKDDSTEQIIAVPTASIDNGKLSSTLKINHDEAVWHAVGDLDAEDKQLYLKVFAEGQPLQIPLIKHKWGLTVKLDTLEAELKKVNLDGRDQLTVKGLWSVKNLLVHHWRISDKDIRIFSGQLDATFLVGKDYVQLNKESQIQLKRVKANPFIKFTLKPHKAVELGLSMPKTNAQELFDAFPDGLFDNLDGIRVQGKLKYDFNAFVDFDNPDSVRLFSEMKKEDFRINSWGKTNLAKINVPFTYVPYEDGKPMRSIFVGPSNPNFTPLDQISPHLKNAVLTAEDPSFFSHNGFVEEAIRNSISTNLKAKAFKRGGSTISMQLVKNIYLNRDKTLTRKIEEILMVWLIESNRVVSKQRMLEVYLNIIEWGRNVYGIGEAARFYFGKSPAALNLGESIFLASIVPKPKSGLYPFQYDGHLKPYMGGYFRLIGGIMARRGLAMPDSSSYGFYQVVLREPLRPVQPIDTLSEDSIKRNYYEQELKETTTLLERLFGKDKQEGKEKEKEH